MKVRELTGLDKGDILTLTTMDEVWEREIKARHPVISHFPKESWPFIVRFNGWLPLPTQEESYGD